MAKSRLDFIHFWSQSSWSAFPPAAADGRFFLDVEPAGLSGNGARPALGSGAQTGIDGSAFPSTHRTGTATPASARRCRPWRQACPAHTRAVCAAAWLKVSAVPSLLRCRAVRPMRALPALRLVIGHQGLGAWPRFRVVADPDAAGGNAPGAGLGFVERDLILGKPCAHLSGFVVGHVAQVEQEFGHAAMVPRAHAERLHALTFALCLLEGNIMRRVLLPLALLTLSACAETRTRRGRQRGGTATHRRNRRRRRSRGRRHGRDRALHRLAVR